MSYDRRITDLAARAAAAAAKNAEIAPQLLFADITFVLADAVEDGRIVLGPIEATRPPIGTDEVVERVARAMVQASGRDPDGITAAARGQMGSRKLWELYEHLARAAIAAMPAIPQSLGDHALPPSGLSRDASQAKPAAAIAEYRPSTETGRAAPVYTDDPLSNMMMDFLDERADAWMEETHIVSATHGMCATFAGFAPREILVKFRRALEAQFHLCFVEGGLRAWEEISAQQKALGTPLPAASVGQSGNRQDRETGLGPKDEHAVAAISGETPTPGPAIDQDGGE